MYELLHYFSIVVQDGDWLNDWLTHMPVEIQPLVIEAGKLLAMWIGA